MRVFIVRALIDVLAGVEDLLRVHGRLESEASPDVARALRDLPTEVCRAFNPVGEISYVPDYMSEPTVVMPDEFEFHLDVESLDRFAREVLIQSVVDAAKLWQTKHVAISDLWIGGRGEVLMKEERSKLTEATRKIWDLPIRGKTFVLGADVVGVRRLAFRDAIRQHGGVVLTEPLAEPDYLVTDLRNGTKDTSTPQGKRTLSMLELAVLFDRPSDKTKGVKA